VVTIAKQKLRERPVDRPDFDPDNSPHTARLAWPDVAWIVDGEELPKWKYLKSVAPPAAADDDELPQLGQGEPEPAAAEDSEDDDFSDGDSDDSEDSSTWDSDDSISDLSYTSSASSISAHSRPGKKHRAEGPRRNK